MMYEVLKALHLIFIVTWFAGLFYLPRLFIYHTEALEDQSLTDDQKQVLVSRFKIMEQRLWYGITWPSCVLTLLFGFSLLQTWLPLTDHNWLITKLGFVFFLFLYHLSLGSIFKKLKNDLSSLSSFHLRVWNEVATIFLVAIVFLVVLKDILPMGYALGGLFLFILLLMSAIKIYKKRRVKG